jgi:hypothetical protein
MLVRPWSRLLLAVLLAWQLNAAVAVVHASVAPPAVHCGHHGGSDGLPTGPDCCHHGSAPCECAQPAAPSVVTLAFDDTPAAEPRPLGNPGPPPEASICDFFRPPI